MKETKEERKISKGQKGRSKDKMEEGSEKAK